MTELPMSEERPRSSRLSVYRIGTVLLYNRRLLVALMFVGASLGVATAFLLPRRYVSRVTFIPQSQEGVASGLALAASQFGIRVPSGGDGWGPPVYVELLRSRAILESIAIDSFVATGFEGSVSAATLFEIDAGTPERRLAKTLRALRSVIRVGEDVDLGAVRLTVVTKWPSVSRDIARKLVEAVNRFNLEVRRSQAAEERRFVQNQADAAETQLRLSEDRLQAFLQRNRAVEGAAELIFGRDRLQRQVDLRQQVLSTLLQSLEEARIREVRDTPVITEVEEARLALEPEPRGTTLKAFLGLVIGLFVALGIAVSRERVSESSRSGDSEAQEFFAVLKQLTGPSRRA